MGNTCPSGFQLSPAAPGQCVVRCPTEKGFVFRIVDGVPHCVHSNQPDAKISLNPQPALDIKPNEPVPSLEELAVAPNTNLRGYKQEYERFQQELPLAESKLNREKELGDAFRALQTAENVRDKSPETYQEARIRYYTLLKGDTWKQEESERVGKAEADPLLQQYRASYTSILNQIEKQEKTIDVVKGVKDKVLSLRDDLDYSVSTFGKQIKDIKNQINMDRAHPKEDPYFWLNFLLNALLVLIGLGVAFVVFGRLRAAYSQRSVTYSSTNAVSNLS